MAATLVLVRIDDRLIHGQVAIGWVKATSPDTIVVANDAVASDSLQRNLMELATPPHLQVAICRVDECAALCNGPQFAAKRVLVLFSSPQDVLRAVEAGLDLHQLNVGGMRFKPGKRQILKAVSIDDQDVAVFRDLAQRGIKITVQMVPTDEPVEISKYLE
jgi:mannose/fructose/sorbose-specific phosphotransferase system IIB component